MEIHTAASRSRGLVSLPPHAWSLRLDGTSVLETASPRTRGPTSPTGGRRRQHVQLPRVRRLLRGEPQLRLTVGIPSLHARPHQILAVVCQQVRRDLDAVACTPAPHHLAHLLLAVTTAPPPGGPRPPFDGGAPATPDQRTRGTRGRFRRGELTGDGEEGGGGGSRLPGRAESATSCRGWEE
eukprot:1191639-Prorocentrum_minimum.AAC.8